MTPELRRAVANLVDAALEIEHLVRSLSTDDGDAASPPPRRSGPELIATLGDVLAIRAELVERGLPHGHRSIARAGGWSPITVRRRLAGH